MAVWDITSYDYSGNSFSGGGSLAGLNGVFIKSDGTTVYTCRGFDDTVLAYSLATAWDLSSVTFLNSFDISAQSTNPFGLFIGDSGSKLYVVDPIADEVQQYALSTAWDLSTGSYTQALDVSGQETVATGVAFQSNGLRMFVCGQNGDDVTEYTLSTAWDISTASVGSTFSVSGQTGAPTDIAFGETGSRMYISSGGTIYEYDLTTAWDISTASFTQSQSFSGQDGTINGLTFRGSGDNFYIAGNDNGEVFQYNVVTPISATATMAGSSTASFAPIVVEESAASMAGTSTFAAANSNITASASMSGASTFSGVGNAETVAPSRTVDTQDGANAVSVLLSINSADTDPSANSVIVTPLPNNLT